ncbi:MAG: transcriptional regulator [Chamaesiphon sp. CSU_1_12]|nr:transcriptional regulator [Chamaesiphon sp. CSU_1_12]
MTLTFNRDKYKELLAEYQPNIIKTEVENEEALTIVEQLMHLQKRTPEQDAIYELLVILIERFEQEFYKPSLESNPGSMLAFLMDQRDLQPIDLVEIFGSEAAVDDALAGRVNIDRSTADRLGELFHVDPSLFQ